ncbi:hypothetical protein K440DRAFT_638812 [Wilcoxina mikolae CBS 423.85]|nr:hypothetical protein K440DRAFT_638812 [Wilcoxina mikolae CBS 423.85]
MVDYGTQKRCRRVSMGVLVDGNQNTSKCDRDIYGGLLCDVLKKRNGGLLARELRQPGGFFDVGVRQNFRTARDLVNVFQIRKEIWHMMLEDCGGVETNALSTAKDGRSFRNEELVKNLGEFQFAGEDAVFQGKELGFPLDTGGTVWLRYHFALHGHAIPMSRTEYEETKSQWLEPGPPIVVIQLAIVGPKMCVVILDKNKLMSLTGGSTKFDAFDLGQAVCAKRVWKFRRLSLHQRHLGEVLHVLLASQEKSEWAT